MIVYRFLESSLAYLEDLASFATKRRRRRSGGSRSLWRESFLPKHPEKMEAHSFNGN